MIYAYIRVSTDKQTTENQRYEIKRYCKEHNIVIDAWIEETISSTQDLKKRKLGRLLRKLHKGDLVLASEMSRLGRKLLEVMSILNSCMNSGACVWTIKDNFKLNADIQSKVLAFAFGLAAEIERNLIAQRTKEALAARRAKGTILGRPKGRLNGHLKLLNRKSKLRRMLRIGVSKNKIAKKLGVSKNTLYLFIDRYGNSV